MSNQNKPFHGRAIYQPSGAAGEYSQWACNLFNGCSNRCTYCYNRHSMTAKVLGADEVTMKKQLTDGNVKGPGGFYFSDWADIVRYEIEQNSEQIIRDGGLFMSFVSDPLLPQTYSATLKVLDLCNLTLVSLHSPIPVTILTKSAWWLRDSNCDEMGYCESKYVRAMLEKHKHHLSLGFTLTGMGDMERDCISDTQERIDAMKWAHEQGIYTWASIEPVIDYERAIGVIILSLPYCREYRIGLASKLGIKYDPADVCRFKRCVETTIGDKAKIVWKKSVLDKIKKSQ